MKLTKGNPYNLHCENCEKHMEVGISFEVEIESPTSVHIAFSKEGKFFICLKCFLLGKDNFSSQFVSLLGEYTKEIIEYGNSTPEERRDQAIKSFIERTSEREVIQALLDKAKENFPSSVQVQESNGFHGGDESVH